MSNVTPIEAYKKNRPGLEHSVHAFGAFYISIIKMSNGSPLYYGQVFKSAEGKATGLIMTSINSKSFGSARRILMRRIRHTILGAAEMASAAGDHTLLCKILRKNISRRQNMLHNLRQRLKYINRVHSYIQWYNKVEHNQKSHIRELTAKLSLLECSNGQHPEQQTPTEGSDPI